MKKFVLLFSLLFALNLDINTASIPTEEGTECVQPASDVTAPIDESL